MSKAAQPIDQGDQRFPWVDEAAQSIKLNIWKRRSELWNGNVPDNLIDILDPGVALATLGYKVEAAASIGELYVNGVRSEVAGIIDRDVNVVTISQLFPAPVQRFTLAHELAHAVLHPQGGRMHRDLPLEKAGVVRNLQEIEANRFASVFLMSERLVLEQFSACFRIHQFHLTEEMAYALCGTGADSVRRRCRGLRQLSMLIAGACSFNGKHFLSLASQFRVSNTAMAIRLEELGLVTY